MQFTELVEKSINWTNDNQGVLSLVLFFITMIFGWVSGIFSALRRRPKFKISSIVGPTFCCTYPTGNKYNEYDAHQTGIAIYLCVANVGSAPSSIGQIRIAYHWSLQPWTIKWLRYTVGWFWLDNQSVALADFQVKFGEHIKIYPFLTQKNHQSPIENNKFLEVGQSTNGVVYFEQQESWGGCFPKVTKKMVNLKVEIRDVFGGRHIQKFSIPAVSFDEAIKYNPRFGITFCSINGTSLPRHGEYVAE